MASDPRDSFILFSSRVTPDDSSNQDDTLDHFTGRLGSDWEHPEDDLLGTGYQSVHEKNLVYLTSYSEFRKIMRSGQIHSSKAGCPILFHQTPYDVPDSEVCIELHQNFSELVVPEVTYEWYSENQDMVSGLGIDSFEEFLDSFHFVSGMHIPVDNLPLILPTPLPFKRVWFTDVNHMSQCSYDFPGMNLDILA